MPALALPAREVHVWWAPVAAREVDRPGILELLDGSERERAQGLLVATARARFVTGRALLRAILGRCLGVPGQRVRLVYGAHGKPALDPSHGCREVGFNLAHSGGLVILAVAPTHELGVDLEQLRPVDRAERLGRRFFSPDEHAHIAAIEDTLDRSRAFLHCWTCKEALVKALGTTLVPALGTVEVDPDPSGPPRLLRLPAELGRAEDWSLLPVRVDPAYLCVAAIRDTGWRVVVRAWKP